MELKLQTVLEIGNAVLRLSGKAIRNPKLHYATAKNVRIFKPELETAEEARLALCEQYGVLNAEGNGYDFEPEARKRFDAALKELRETPVEIEPYRIRYSWLVDSVELLSPFDLALLMDIVEMDVEPGAVGERGGQGTGFG